MIIACSTNLHPFVLFSALGVCRCSYFKRSRPNFMSCP